MLWNEKASKYLKKYWKISELKDKQFDVINELLLGNDVVGLLPTGYGKSMCYLIPPLVTKKVMLIVSPLISLMDDQKEKLINMGIPCSALHGNNKNRDQELYQIIDNKIKIVYMSPEYLIKGDGLELAHNLNSQNMLGFLAVDESHCISVWGQDFRPEYTKLKSFREELPDIPILAVTATATETVCEDIVTILGLKNPVLVKASFDRPNLYIKISEIPTEQKVEKKTPKSKPKTITKQVSKDILVKNYIDKYPNDKIIIYMGSRQDTESLAKDLNLLYPNICDAYHAGLSKDKREEIQTKFSSSEIKLIISTVAFGMGIDQTVKVVIIFGSPSSIEEYYQQIGRGGRDGKSCETVLYFDYSKLQISKFMLRDTKIKYPKLYKSKINNLDKISKLVYSQTCRRKFILEYFNEDCDFYTCGNCDNCCETELIDMTDKFWPIIFKPGNSNLIAVTNEIRNKYLTNITIKDKVVDLDLLNTLWKWKQTILTKKYNKTNLPIKLKLLIPKKFVEKKEENIKNNTIYLTFDEQINKYEKMISL